LIAWGTLAAHITGFAAIDFFGSVQSMSFFSGSVLTSLFPIAITGVSFWLLFFLGEKLRQNMGSREFASLSPEARQTSKGREAEEWEELFNEQCIDVEDDVAGLCVGLLISRSVRQVLTGYLPPVHGEPFQKSKQECGMLFVAAACLLALQFFCSGISWRPRSERFVHVFLAVLAMTSGWCMLFLTQWVFYAPVKTGGSHMSVHQVIALSNSLLCIPAMLAVDYFYTHNLFSKKGLRSVATSFALLVGLSWEATFDTAVESIEEKIVEGEVLPEFVESLTNISLVAGLCSLVLPAWLFYILPQAHPKEAAESK
jgi:hypothetical protein